MAACAHCCVFLGHNVGICCFNKRCQKPYIVPMDDLPNIVQFCHDSQNNACRRTSCNYVHASREEEYLFFKSGMIPRAMMDRCAVSPVYALKNYPYMLYYGEFSHFTQIAPTQYWAPRPTLPPPLHLAQQGTHYYGYPRPPMNVYGPPVRSPNMYQRFTRPDYPPTMSRPVTEPLTIDIPPTPTPVYSVVVRRCRWFLRGALTMALLIVILVRFEDRPEI